MKVYEGVLQDEAGVRRYLRHAADVFERLRQQEVFAADQWSIVSGAGSAWYDVFAEVFAPLRSEADVLLRPGCYLTCDAGLYRTAQQQITERNTIAREVNQQLGGTLRSALEVWAYVQSVPEPGLAIVGLGKRDAAFDVGLPAPVLHFRPGAQTEPTVAPTDWTTTRLMDQHLYLAIPEEADLQVGDMLAFAILAPVPHLR